MAKRTLDTAIEKVGKSMTSVDAHAASIDILVDKLVDDAIKPLDDYMKQVRDMLSNPDDPPSDMELDDVCLNLPSLLYYIVNRKEKLAVKATIARAVKDEAYNTVYDKMEGQVGPRKVAAELASQLEALTESVYKQAHARMDAKVWASTELMNSVKKVMSRRMNERYS